MRNLRGLAWRGFRRRPLRSALTIIGIALGVGLVFAALATNAAVDAAVARTVLDTAGRTDVTIRAVDENGLPSTVASTAAQTPGVAAATPSLRRRTFASSLERGPFGPILVAGIDPSSDRLLHDYSLSSGTFLAPGSDGDLLVTSEWAAEHGVGLGDPVSFVGPGGQPVFTVTGILEPSGPALAESGRIAFVTLSAAQELFALPDRIDQVEIRADPAAGVAAVEGSLEQRLTGQPHDLVPTQDLVDSLAASTDEFEATTILIAAVALFVGGFLIFNTLSMTVTERIREIGLLRAAGATRRQVNVLFLEEALVLGVAGTAIGVLVGVVAAAAMASVVRNVEGIPSGDPVFAPMPLLLAVALGFVVTLVSALEPARRAGRIPPVEALRARAGPEPGVGERLRWLLVISAVLALGVLLVMPGGNAEPSRVVRPFVVFGLLIVAAMLSPLVLGATGRIASAIFAHTLRAEELLARGGLARDRHRTAVTLGALVIGLGMVVAVASVAQNSRRASVAWLDSVVPGDYVATAITPIPADFAGDLAAVPGVATVTPMRRFDVEAAGRRIDAMAIEPAAYEATGAMEVLGGDRAAAFGALAAGGSVLVPASLAGELGVGAGATLIVRTSQGDVPFRVAALVAHSLPGKNGETLVMSAADASTFLGVTGVDLFAVRAAPGAPASLRADLESTAAQYALEVSDRDQVAGAISSSLGRVFGLYDMLALVAVLVAALGIVNTLTMNVYERIREIGVLRATGMTRTQVWRMVVLEAGILGLAGAVTGIVAGLVVGGVMLLMSHSPEFQPQLDIPWLAIFFAFVLGVGVASVAAAYPARVASRLTIVRAVGFD